MNRLRLRNPGQAAHSRGFEPLKSDRESFHFPEGGVFGAPAASHGATAVSDHVGDIERTLDRMQAQLDSIADQVEEVYHLPTTPPDWTPPAAA